MREREASDRHADAITVERAELDKRLTFLPRLTVEEEGHMRHVLIRCLRLVFFLENKCRQSNVLCFVIGLLMLPKAVM